jgi:hypothetical protein
MRQSVTFYPARVKSRLDPIFDLDAVVGLDVNATYASILEGATVTDDYIVNLNQVNIAASAEASKQALESYIQTNMPDATADDIFGYREIVQKARGIFPPTDNGGPFGISEERERFSEVPASLRYLVNFQVPGINYTVAAPGIAEESISVSYVPATPYDVALVDYYGDIFNTPAFLLHIKPVLRINGEAVAEGSSVGLGSRQVLYSSFLAPEEEIWSTNSRSLTAGAEYSIVLDLQQVSARLIEARTERLEALAADLPDEELIPQELTEEMLHLTGLTYFAGVDTQSNLLAKRLGIVWTRQPAQAILAKEVQVSYFFWIPWSLSRASRSIDVKRNILNPISVTGEQDHETAWMIGTGTLGSNMEHTIFKELFDVDAVSTIRILGLAGQQGVPVYLVTKDNMETVLPELSTYSVVKDNIREAVAQGWIAVCPQRNMSLGDWTGQGWLIIDPTNGSAGYLLAGGLVTNNVIDVTCGGSTTKKAKGDFKEALTDFLVELSDIMLIWTLLGKAYLYFIVLIYYLGYVWGGGLGMAFLYGIFFMGFVAMFIWLTLTFLYLQYLAESGTAWYRRRRICYA